MLMLKGIRGIIPNLQPQPHNTSPKSWWNNAPYCILLVCIAILVYLIPYDSKVRTCIHTYYSALAEPAWGEGGQLPPLTL